MAALSLAGLVLSLAAAAALAQISQPAGTAGCISDFGSGPCIEGHALSATEGVVVSPDGKSVYVASYFSNAVVRLNRNRTTGAIGEPAGSAACISETSQEAGPCADGHALDDPLGLAMSPDGKSVYVTSPNSWALVRLNRNTTTGAITQPPGSAGCISETGSGPCIDGHALVNAFGVAVSPDGKSVYVAGQGSDAVVRLDRTP